MIGDSAVALPHVTMTTPRPGRASDGIFHPHATLPLPSAFWFAPGIFTKLPAVETYISEHSAFGDVWTTTWALPPGRTTETDTKRTSEFVCAGVAVGLAIEPGFAVAVREIGRVGVALILEAGVGVVLPGATDVALPGVPVERVRVALDCRVGVAVDARVKVGVNVSEDRRVKEGCGVGVGVSTRTASADGARKPNTSSTTKNTLQTNRTQTARTAMTNH